MGATGIISIASTIGISHMNKTADAARCLLKLDGQSVWPGMTLENSSIPDRSIVSIENGCAPKSLEQSATVIMKAISEPSDAVRNRINIFLQGQVNSN